MAQGGIDSTTKPPKKKFVFKSKEPKPGLNNLSSHINSSSVNEIKTTLIQGNRLINDDKINNCSPTKAKAEGLKKFIDKQSSLMVKKQVIKRGSDDISHLVSLRTVSLISTSKSIEEKIKLKAAKLKHSEAKKNGNKKTIYRISSNSSMEDFDLNSSFSPNKSVSFKSINKYNEEKLQTSICKDTLDNKKGKFTFKKVTNKTITSLDDLLKDSPNKNKPAAQYYNPITTKNGGTNNQLTNNSHNIENTHTKKSEEIGIRVDDWGPDDLDYEMSQIMGPSTSKTTNDTLDNKKGKFTFKKVSNKPITSIDDLLRDSPIKNQPAAQYYNPITKKNGGTYNQLANNSHNIENTQIINSKKCEEVALAVDDWGPDDLDYEMSQIMGPSTSKTTNETTHDSTDLNKSIEECDKYLMENIDWDSQWNDDDLNRAINEAKSKFEQLATGNDRAKQTNASKHVTANECDLNATKQCDWTTVFEPIEQCTSKNTSASRKDNTAEFRGVYPYTEVMSEVLHSRFGLLTYRPNQQEIINASLAQHDCFVLMPTGGGKSLCYQLPAVLTPGVTIVISPLRALISDQVDKLNALDIPSAHMCSDVNKADMSIILAKLAQKEPTIKLLYLTPEKIVASKNTCDMLRGLYQRGKLARFVIDECHCLSQWGHDFRPDYKQLSCLRKNYANVPIMCLTATATNTVQRDVLQILNLKNVKTFIRSFNRPNIKYKVMPKNGKMVVQEISDLIKSKFLKKSGIVYCLGRNDCDSLAKDLCKLGVKAKSYHAGMADKAREKVQRDWMNDLFHVIVATIAFGMGIDKPDVRFVIHNSVPKSVEAFYQESGRGGRDGETAFSFLFYSYGDVVRLQKLVKLDRKVTKSTLEGHFDSIQQMAQYCENKIDCRRYLQLVHLGEKFDKQICIDNKATTCDNCENSSHNEMMDITKESREIAELVKDIATHENYTMLHLVDVYKGSKVKKVVERRHDRHKYFGAGSHMTKSDIHRVLKDLMFKKVVIDYCTYNGEFPVVYTKPGPNYQTLFNSNTKLTICIDKNVQKPTTTKKPLTTANTTEPEANNSFKISNLKVQCHEDLLEACRTFALERNSTLSSIMNLSAIKTMSEKLPNTPEEFLKIQHVTKANFDKFGAEFLRITSKYRSEIEKMKPVEELNESFGGGGDDWAENSRSSTGGGYKRGTKRKFTNYKKGKARWKKKKTS